MKIILASTSQYRAELIAKLGMSFEKIKPAVDEEMIKDLLLIEKAKPLEVAETLSRKKAASIHRQFPEATIVAGDQLVNWNGQILGKPLTVEKAFQQLSSMKGRTHELITSTTLIINSKIFHHNNISKMTLKDLSDSEIKSYVELDQPLDCAGSIKIESYGISLFEKIECDDFSAIQGLPLIWLSNTLKRNGYELFKK